MKTEVDKKISTVVDNIMQNPPSSVKSFEWCMQYPELPNLMVIHLINGKFLFVCQDLNEKDTLAIQLNDGDWDWDYSDVVFEAMLETMPLNFTVEFLQERLSYHLASL